MLKKIKTFLGKIPLLNKLFQKKDIPAESTRKKNNDKIILFSDGVNPYNEILVTCDHDYIITDEIKSENASVKRLYCVKCEVEYIQTPSHITYWNKTIEKYI